jgi:hypothetical protein
MHFCVFILFLLFPFLLTFHSPPFLLLPSPLLRLSLPCLPLNAPSFNPPPLFLPPLFFPSFPPLNPLCSLYLLFLKLMSNPLPFYLFLQTYPFSLTYAPLLS